MKKDISMPAPYIRQNNKIEDNKAKNRKDRKMLTDNKELKSSPDYSNVTWNDKSQSENIKNNEKMIQGLSKNVKASNIDKAMRETEKFDNPNIGSKRAKK